MPESHFQVAQPLDNFFILDIFYHKHLRGAKKEEVWDRKMAPILSLTPSQLEILCQMYHQIMEVTSDIEIAQRELSQLTDKVVKASPSRLLPVRVSFNLAENWTRWVTARQLHAKLKDYSLRNLRRYLARLRKSQFVVTRLERGLWAVPGSRPGESGRPPLKYSLNPQLMGDYITSDSVDEKTLRFLSLAEKFLLETATIKECYARTMTAALEMASSSEFSAFMDVARRKIPEIERLLARIEKSNGFDKAEQAKTISKLRSVIGDEVGAAASRSVRRLTTDVLPKAEAMRLGVWLGLYGLPTSWGWEGGD